MKTRLKLLFTLLIFGIAFMVSSNTAMAATPYQTYGPLKVSGTKLVSHKTGQPVTLRGVSSHGINWDVGYPFISYNSLKTLRDSYGVNAVRLAMYTTEYYGYCDKAGANVSQEQVQRVLKSRIDVGVKAASSLGMYVIIDWHILNDLTPNKYKTQAIAFFKEMASKYAKYNNVIFEICNEPNGGTSWAEIKSYANSVIPVIRAYNKNSIIIVGTPNWSQDVDVAAQSPLKYSNVMYTLHFYAATHGQYYRDKLTTALKKGLPVMVTEFGLSESWGGGSLNTTEAKAWLDYLDKYNISYFAWSLSNKNESSALLNSWTTKKYGWNSNDLSPAGKWVFSQYLARNKKNAVVDYRPAQVKNFTLQNLATRRVYAVVGQVANANGYQVFFSTTSNFKSYYTMNLIGTNKGIKHNFTVGKTYYVKVRAARKVNGKWYYGACSPVKTIKITR